MPKDELNTPNRQEAEQGKVVLEDDSLFSKGFTQVPNAVLRDPTLSDGAKLTYAMLLSYAWSDNSSFPGQQRLAEHLGKERKAVIRYIQELKEKKLLRVERRGQGLTNIYYIRTSFEADVPSMGHQEVPNLTHQEVPPTGHKEYSSKNTQNKNTKSYRKANALKTEKGGEGTQASARSHREPMTTGKQNTRLGSTDHKPNGKVNTAAKKPVYIGKPLTQDEIDEKRKQGQNASGFTPLAHIIPASHWQELEAHAATNSNGNGNGNLHYHQTTKNAPLSIDATIEQLSTLLHDEPENTAQNINRAAKLCRQVGYDSDQFANLLWNIYHEIKKKPDKLFKTRGADGRANKMPVFFTELEKVLGVKPKQPN